MNTKKKIEQYLRAAPKPSAPTELLDRLKEDVAITEVKTHSSGLRRWFAPNGESISLWRVAAAAAIAIAIMLPLSYGAVKVIKSFTIEVTFDYPEDDTMYGYGASSTVVAKGNTNINTLEEARKAVEEFRKLYREGKAEEIEPGVWVATLSDGEEFAYAGDPEQLSLMDIDIEEAKQILKERFDEIHELKKAGKYERTFLEEIEKDGAKIRLYQDSFILSNGKVITLTSAEEVTEKDEN